MTPIDPAAPLDCASAQRLIDAFLLDEVDTTSGAALRVHLTGCAACAADLRGITHLMRLLAVLPEPTAAADLDERLILAAIADRQRRHEHRSWLRDLRTRVFRGAIRTTGTLAATIITVALLGATLVFAAGFFLAGTALNPTQGATVAPEVTPTLTPQQSATPTVAPTGTTGPVAVSATPTPAPVPTVDLTPTPEPTPTAEPTLAPALTAEPTLAPTPTPTEKPRRTPPPSPTDTPAPTADVTPSP